MQPLLASLLKDIWSQTPNDMCGPYHIFWNNDADRSDSCNKYDRALMIPRFVHEKIRLYDMS